MSWGASPQPVPRSSKTRKPGRNSVVARSLIGPAPSTSAFLGSQPWHAPLNRPGVPQRLLDNAQRLEQHANLVQVRRKIDQDLGALDVKVGEEPVLPLDAALGVLTLDAEVGLAARAGTAIVRAAHEGDYDISLLEPRHSGRVALDPAEALMADDELALAGRRLALLAAVELDVGAVDAQPENLYAHLARSGLGRRDLDEARAIGGSRPDGDCSHRRLPPVPGPSSAPRGLLLAPASSLPCSGWLLYVCRSVATIFAATPARSRYS
jgi:hypothetical protein